MGKIKNNQKGFTAVEGLLIILILAVIGFGSYYVYHANHKDKTVSASTKSAKASSSTNTATNPYAGWKTGSLQYEKITYEYPGNWALSDNSQSASQVEAQGGCTVSNGADDVTLTAPGGATVELSTGQECKAGLGYGPYAGFIPIKVLGKNYYLAGADPTDPSHIVNMVVATNTSSDNLSFPASKNITGSDSPVNVFSFTPADSSGESLTALESDPSFTTAKLIFESMLYK